MAGRQLPKNLGGDTARIIGKYIDSDGLTEARKRIHHLFDTHDTIVVGFSGGKDSLAVLHRVHDIQLERGITSPVKVWFYDEELIPDQVIDFVNEYRQLDWVDMVWLCVPLKSSKFILGDNHEYIQWDPDRRHVRQMPAWATTLADLGIPAGTAAGLTQYGMNLLEARLFRGKIAHLTGIDKNLFPLSTLCFVASHCIGKLHLQGIEEPVLPDCLHSIRLERNVLIIFFYLPEELFLLFMGQGWRLARQSIQQNRCLQLVIVIIGELQQKRGETETVKVDAATNPQDLGTVAIRKESRKFFTLNFELGTLNFMIS